MSSTVGAQSLPSEILTVVLTDVVESAIPDERSWTALKLTHVCELFRHVALDCPRLWTCLSRKLGRPGLDLIEACIERSKDQPLDVILYRYVFHKPDGGSVEDLEGTAAVDSIADFILPVCVRWRRYTTFLVMAPYFDSETLFITSSEFDSMSSRLSAPLLEVYSFGAQAGISDAFQPGTISRLHFPLPPPRSWNLPRLHSISAQDALMSRFVPIIRHESCAQLRNASVGITGANLVSQLYSLFIFKYATSLTNLRLSFRNCNFHNRRLEMHVLELAHVKSLHIDLLDCSQSVGSEHSLWKSFRHFDFSGVVDLTILLDIGDPTFKLGVGHRSFDTALHSFLVADAYPQYSFPSLETLNVEVRQVHGDEAAELLLHHSCVPSLKHLRIHSTSNVSLSDNVGEFDEALLPRHFLFGSKVVPIALQTITFDIPGVGGVVQWVQELMFKMKDQLCWDGFVKLTVKNGENGPRVIPLDEVESWCDENRGSEDV